MIKVMCVGAGVQDVFLRGEALSAKADDSGEGHLDIKLGEKIYLEEATFSTGGNAGNASVTFARQGLGSMFVGAVGDDPAGKAVMRTLEAEGVDLSLLTIVPGARTGYSVILLADNGARTILRIKGDTEADNGHEDFFDHMGCDWLYLSSIGAFDLTSKVISHGQEQSIKMAFNPGTLDLKDPERLKTLIPQVDLLFLNKEEMQTLYQGETIEDLAKAAAQQDGVVAVVSDGPRGVAVCDGKKVYRAGMYEDVPVVDRLGAGDAFGSGFTAMYAQGKSIEDCITFASANSTSVVSYIGAKKGILSAGAQLHSMNIAVSDV